MIRALLSWSRDDSGGTTRAALLDVSSDRPTNQLARYRCTDALWGWSYRFERPSPELRAHASGLEIGVVLSGCRLFQARHRGHLHFTRGRVSAFDVGEPYTTRFDPKGSAGREIGFLLRVDKHSGWCAPDERLVFSAKRTQGEGALIELAELTALALDGGDRLPVADLERQVRCFVETNAELVKRDPLENARLAMHHDFPRQLYMSYFADMAGVHEDTFARKFSARYGVTPTRYRTQVRLKEAAVLLAARPDLSVREVITKVGFEDQAYFHRAFRAQFGTTPLGLARGLSDAIAAAA